MEQNFDDLCNERKGKIDQSYFNFVLGTFAETASGITREHILLIAQGDGVKKIARNPKSAALLGLLSIAPFAILNAIVGNRIEPFFSLIRPGIHTGPFEYTVLLMVLLLIPGGSFIAARPMFHKGVEGKRNFYLVNALLAALLLTVFVLLAVGLVTDIYRCDVLQIPNCD